MLLPGLMNLRDKFSAKTIFLFDNFMQQSHLRLGRLVGVACLDSWNTLGMLDTFNIDVRGALVQKVRPLLVLRTKSGSAS